MEISRKYILLLLGRVHARVQEAPSEVPERGDNPLICCLGLFAGFFIGQWMGGPWIVIAPAAGFIVGLVGDVKLFSKKRPIEMGKACHG